MYTTRFARSGRLAKRGCEGGGAAALAVRPAAPRDPTQRPRWCGARVSGGLHQRCEVRAQRLT
eukprot:7013212-Prymnesium_polylepis.1